MMIGWHRMARQDKTRLGRDKRPLIATNRKGHSTRDQGELSLAHIKLVTVAQQPFEYSSRETKCLGRATVCGKSVVQDISHGRDAAQPQHFAPRPASGTPGHKISAHAGAASGLGTHCFPLGFSTCQCGRLLKVVCRNIIYSRLVLKSSNDQSGVTL